MPPVLLEERPPIPLERPVRLPLRREPKHLQQMMSMITSKIVTMIWGRLRKQKAKRETEKVRTVVITLTMVMMTLAIAPMMALMPRPMAENIEPYKRNIELAE